ncbi:unnamed protein product [Discula destructiva]
MDTSTTILVTTLLLALIAFLTIFACLYRRFWSEWFLRINSEPRHRRHGRRHRHRSRRHGAYDEEKSIASSATSRSSASSCPFPSSSSPPPPPIPTAFEGKPVAPVPPAAAVPIVFRTW